MRADKWLEICLRDRRPDRAAVDAALRRMHIGIYKKTKSKC
jgi:hypothetical protein